MAGEADAGVRALVEFLARSVVEHPSEVRVTEVAQGGATAYEIRVAPEDMGQVIGRQGRIIQAIRTLARSLAAREGTRVTVDVAD